MLTKIDLATIEFDNVKEEDKGIKELSDLLNNFIELNAIANFMVETQIAMPPDQVANFQIRMHELNEAIEASPFVQKAKKEFLVLAAIRKDRN